VDPELEAYVARAQDPVLIPGIYNYCHHRCEQCPFTGRCYAFREERRNAREHPDRSREDQMSADYACAEALIQAWCERQGIDVQGIQGDEDTDAAVAEHERIYDMVRRDPLLLAAKQYAIRAYEIVQPLDSLSRFHSWAPAVDAALKTIAWHSGMIGPKIGRALHGAAASDQPPDEDPVQNDWNGSVKVVRLAIAESRNAWETLFLAGDTPPDASIRQTVALLETIDRDLAVRFPLAMEFVRPGFDEPEVAAGARTRLAPFEPRPRTLRRRLQLWSASVLQRLRGSNGARSASRAAGVHEKGPIVFQRPGLEE
jgi:hypothetical protein